MVIPTPTLVMTPCGFALLCKLVGEAAEIAGVAAGTEGSAGAPVRRSLVIRSGRPAPRREL